MCVMRLKYLIWLQLKKLSRSEQPADARTAAHKAKLAKRVAYSHRYASVCDNLNSATSLRKPGRLF